MMCPRAWGPVAMDKGLKTLILELVSRQVNCVFRLSTELWYCAICFGHAFVVKKKSLILKNKSTYLRDHVNKLS